MDQFSGSKQACFEVRVGNCLGAREGTVMQVASNPSAANLLVEGLDKVQPESKACPS
jgi:hypothetical protein